MGRLGGTAIEGSVILTHTHTAIGAPQEIFCGCKADWNLRLTRPLIIGGAVNRSACSMQGVMRPIELNMVKMFYAFNSIAVG